MESTATESVLSRLESAPGLVFLQPGPAPTVGTSSLWYPNLRQRCVLLLALLVVLHWAVNPPAPEAAASQPEALPTLASHTPSE